MTTDKIADMITRIRNAYLAKNLEAVIPHTRLLESITKVLVEEKYLASYKVEENDKGFKVIVAKLNFIDGEPALQTITRISKPGRRIYKSVSELHPIVSGLGIAILSTPKGVMTDREAKKQKVGGEVLCELY